MSHIAGGRAFHGYRILVVEDAPDIRDVLALLLRADGAEVKVAANGHTALQLAAAWDFDVLLTDLGLPDVTGDLLIKEIHGLKTRPPRVVVMTGYGEPYQARAREAGAHAVLTKPLEWAELCDELTAGDEALAA
ncbi:MAG: response regulator [Candidatus Rokubacteria bacterium]|nr:response regulator [Candidatus Rokubacteria bacterium]